MILGKGSRTIAPFPVSCYTVGEIRAASAMTRLEAHFFKRSQQERDEKAIRAANSILKPRKIRACKPRISEREPRKGTETVPAGVVKYPVKVISEREPRKGTETRINAFKEDAHVISEREPRKGTETCRLIDGTFWAESISEREPRKGTETC